MGLLKWDAPSVAFVRNLLIAFIPAVVLGVAFNDQIDAMLESARVVAWALIVGGVAILVIERLISPQESGGVAALSVKRALTIGLVQCLAMIPGVSRSGATIMGAMSIGVDRKTAAEFSFFLAVPTLVGATVLQVAKNDSAIGQHDLGLIGIGFIVSFIVAVAVVKGFLAVVTRYGFAPFAYYRIIAGVAALVWLG
jgi:undecaprenyl-diphosphatase